MKILVTGGSGLIGHEFIKQASVAGHDPFAPGREWADPIWLAGVRWGKWDAVVHLAAAGVRHPPAREWGECMEANFHALRRLCESIKASGARPVIFFAGTVRENETERRFSLWEDPYVVSKKLGGLFVHDWAQGYRGRCVRWKFDSCYEPGQAGNAAALILGFL